MRKGSLVLCFTVLAILSFSCICLAAENPLEELRTPAEIDGFLTRTTSSQEVVDYAATVAKYSNGRVRVEYIARSSSGMLVPMFIIGTPAPKDPAEVPSDKAIVYINCNIHSGEVEGKESMLIFAREAALGYHDDILKDLVILITPNMSPDGNDDLGKWRINSQFTPKLVGTRTNGQGYNINRDMTKLEAFEARGVVNVLNKWDPVIFVDAHATNGSYMRHAITYNWGLHPNTDPDIMEYNRDDFSDLALGSKSYLRTKGKIAVPYGNFGANYSGIVADGWRTFEDYPRYTTNYAGLRNRLAILLEVYSYDPYDVRVDTQYECIYGIFLAVQQEKDKIKQLIEQADARSLARETKGIDPLIDFVALNSTMEPLGPIDVLSYSLDADGRVSADKSARDAENDPYKVEFSEEVTHSITYYGKFVPSGTQEMAAYYFIDMGCETAVELLMRHGIEVSRLTAPLELTDDQFKWFKTQKMNVNINLYEGHRMNRMEGSWEAPSEKDSFPAGTYVVSTAQSLGGLAALLLEPESVDGAFSWNFFDNAMYTEQTRYSKYFNRPEDTNRNIAVPVFKVADFSVLSAATLEKLDGVLPADHPLPDPIEPENNIFATNSGGGSGNCSTGISVLALFALAALVPVLKSRKK